MGWQRSAEEPPVEIMAALKKEKPGVIELLRQAYGRAGYRCRSGCSQ
jgi:hypothetical protein